jgi:flagellar biosynthesis protein FlhB
MSSERTEKPTGRRLHRARKKGQIARSRDLGGALSLFAAVAVLGWTGSAMAHTLGAEVRRALVRMGESPMAAIGAKEVASLALEAAATLGLVCGPVALATVLAVVGTQAAQGGLLFATKALKFDAGRLNPMNGLRRLGFTQAGLDTVKAIAISVAVIVLGYQGIKAVIATSPGLARISPLTAAGLGWGDSLALLRRMSILLFVFAVADYGLQRWRFTKSMRMTKQEVRDDHKLTEGSPETKGRVRRIQMELTRRRMFAAVPKATVVITNPTHYAVALEYHRGAMAAPRVLAKGQNLIAQRIKAIAREHGVPVVENPPLARALYSSAEIGDFIPPGLFEAVAEVLAYLIRLRQLVL